ncbi:MAG: class I SAM-dependent methyltransferase [Candidatus Moranbacteria bacterium]|nr:class I SAM-dependent methyltransferase [Candidatus Moranbacteria bacterium]
MLKKILKLNDLRLNLGRDIIEKYISSVKFDNVLDLGAGDGNDLLIAKKIKPEAELLAIENYERGIENLSAKNIKNFPLNLEKDKIPMEKDQLDLIIANQILEHTKEIFWIFHEICRTLKKGQYLIVGVPNLASFHNRILLFLGRQPSCILTDSAHVRGFTKNEIIRFAKIGGLELVGFNGSNFYPFPPFIAKPLSRIFPSLSVGLFFLFKKTGEYNGEYLKFPVEQRLATNYFIGKD